MRNLPGALAINEVEDSTIWNQIYSKFVNFQKWIVKFPLNPKNNIENFKSVLFVLSFPTFSSFPSSKPTHKKYLLFTEKFLCFTGFCFEQMALSATSCFTTAMSKFLIRVSTKAYSWIFTWFPCFFSSINQFLLINFVLFSFQELGAQLWSCLWNGSCLLLVVHSRHGQRSPNVPSQVSNSEINIS